MLDKLLQDFMILWATIDPIGTMALFTGLTAKMTVEARRKTAFKAIAYASLVLIGSIGIGQILLTSMGISLLSFQLSGGIILFLFGLQMVFSSGSSEVEVDAEHDIAVFPLAIPATATPGAILAVILLTDNHAHTITEQVTTGLVMLSVLLITLIFMLLSGKILNVIGTGGASILVRIMGMILAALSVEFIIEALKAEGWITAITL
ncbi:MarC family protein [uncultured Psychrosphaera sp.]|uniref:MarC family protein n=1 Tax=uncultured Psychrosphaera sp. TaxID=1403522 RepID=UPI002621B4D7|nr:MarC family protein [uncultured Psychrosphaera sp.]